MNKFKIIFFVWILNGDIFLDTFFSFNYGLGDFYLFSLVHPNNWKGKRNEDYANHKFSKDAIATSGPMLTVSLNNLSVTFFEMAFEFSVIFMVNNVMHQRLMIFLQKI